MNSTAESRLHYLDNLRALAMIGGVIFHAALAYSPLMHNLWLTADDVQSPAVDIVAWFTHLFRMPLFFLISGFFAAYLVTKRGFGGMIKNRLLRILLPLVIFLPLCMAATIVPLLAALKNVQHKSSILQMIASAAPGTPPPPPTTMHLWFLYNLVFFCALVWILGQFNWRWLTNKVAQLNPAVFVVFFPLVLVPALTSVYAPTPAPDSFLPQLWSFGFFGVFFMLGYWIFRWDGFLDKFQQYWPLLLAGSLIAYAGYFYLIPKSFAMVDMLTLPAQKITWQKVLGAVLGAYVALWMTLVCLILGKTYLNSHSKVMRFVSDSSYWIYLIHLPLLFVIQFKLLDKDWGFVTEFAVSVSATLAIGFITYLALVRWTPIGWLLNGRKRKSIQIESTATTSMAPSQ